MQNEPRRYSTAEVAHLAGVHKETLLRWLRTGVVAEPNRNRNNWRSFSEDEVQAILTFAKSGLEGIAPVASDLEVTTANLKKIDWNFRGAKTDYLTHTLHPYPAKYIPQIPNALIQELSSVGDTVLDVFCGSGTTLVEALLLKRHAVGLDANPLAVLIAQAKTTPLISSDFDHLTEIAERSSAMGDEVSEAVPNLFHSVPFVSKSDRPGDPSLGFWFQEFVIEELAEITSWIGQVVEPKVKRVAQVALSSIIVGVSRQDSDTRYVRREKKLQPGVVFQRFSQTIKTAILALKEFSDVVEPRFGCDVQKTNAIDPPAIHPVDIVVCSPPYPNAFSYHLYHRLRMIWLFMDVDEFKKVEIGSHRKYSSKGRNRATVETFKGEMRAIFGWLHRTIKPQGFACFVIGNSILNGQLVNNCELLSDVSISEGFTEVARLNRSIDKTKKAFNPTIGKIDNETILVLQNLR